MLSAKEQDNYIKRLIDQHNLIPISRQIKKRSNDLIHNSMNPNILVKELEKPISELNMGDLENRALILYFALTNPQCFHLSKEEVKEIPEKILLLTDYAQEKMRLQELLEKKNRSYNVRKSAKFFAGLLICLRNHFCDRNR